jgi:outer membrane protein assembly factor BamD
MKSTVKLLIRRSALGALLLVAVAAFGATSCAGKRPLVPPGTAQPDKYLFDKASAALKDHDWTEAHDNFQKVLDTYPQSQYLPACRLGIADAYFGQNTPASMVLALNAYREFLTYYPTNPKADYAQYKLAMTHFNQMRGPERDQTQTKDAIQEFQTFIERYPNSPLLPEVRSTLREARDREDQAAYAVGLFYYHVNWYPGAIDRFQSILKNDPDYTYRDAVLFYLAESLVKLKRPAEALPYYERLVKQFERSEYLEDAHKRIAELKATLASRAAGSSHVPFGR